MKPRQTPIDHDLLFKELIRNFFFEFVELFFPDLAAKLDREALDFLDKQLLTGMAEGERREVDLIAKVRLAGAPSFLLVHVEPQSSAASGFPYRMFHYFSRLHHDFRVPVYPVAVFSYAKPRKAAPGEYGVEINGWRVLRFEYRTLQLNRMAWRDYIERPNPVAAALAAKMGMSESERRQVKLECLRLLASLKLNPDKMELISRFIEVYLPGPAPVERVVEASMSGPGVELTKEYLDNLFRPFEEEAERKRMRKAIREAMPKAMARAMPKAMEIAMPKAMEIAMPKAMEKAMEEAMPKAMEEAMPKAMEKARELVAAESGAKYHDMLLGAAQRAWRRRFDTDLPAKHRAAVSALSPDRLIALLDAIPDFPAPAALAKWLR